MSVRNDEAGSAGAMGLLSVTSFPENVWLVSFSSSSIATCEHQAACYGHSVFLATSEEVLSAQLEFLACVWARSTLKITHVLQTYSFFLNRSWQDLSRDRKL